MASYTLYFTCSISDNEGAPGSMPLAAPAFFASSNLAQRAFCKECGTPLSFKYNLPSSRMYVTIGSLDRPDEITLVKQYGIESQLPWVKFCADVPAERTAESPAAQEFLANMRTHQRVE